MTLGYRRQRCKDAGHGRLEPVPASPVVASLPPVPRRRGGSRIAHELTRTAKSGRRSIPSDLGRVRTGPLSRTSDPAITGGWRQFFTHVGNTLPIPLG